MTVSPPHGPIYEETEFWYDTQEKAILYEVNIEPRQGQPEADHARTGERGHLSSHDRSFHWHHQPHGIYLVDKGTDEYLGGTNLANTELVIRLWCEVERNEQPTNSPFRRPPLLPVPKALALFIVEKRAEMYKNESITQALVLLQTYLTAKTIPPAPLQPVEIRSWQLTLGCRRTYDIGFQEMVPFSAKAVWNHTLVEKTLRPSPAEIASRSFEDGTTVNQDLEEGCTRGKHYSTAQSME